MSRGAQLLGILALLPLAAQAAGYGHLLVAQSRIGFVSHQMGVAVPGNFPHFSAQVRFDPAAPQNGMADIRVQTASVDAGGAEANATLADPAWFDVRRWPQATFVSNRLVALGGNRYQASGTLTIKGRSRPATVPFTATAVAGGMALDGALDISRSAWGIGGGEWADPSVVADAVQIRFHLVLQP